MFKNQTPQQLSAYIAATSALLMAALAVLCREFRVFNISWGSIGLLLLSVFTVVFLANFQFIRYYIFRRIKLIYKIIHRHKLPSDFKADKLDMSKNILANVEREVDEWAEQNDRDIEELERLATYRRRFIGDVSHELKTPIFNIQGFIHTLLDGAIHDPQVNMQYLQRAAKNVDRLQAIVEDLETINKLESGQMILDLREFDIHDLTDEVYADLEMRARERNIRLTYKEGAHQHFRVRADKESIRQVLINLVHNSIKYGKEGGVTKISFYDAESYILVEVSDNGIGIDPEHLKHVFDRFFRADKHRSREAGGTGLGLSIVKHIIEAHKQTINVRSTQGQGSTFGFTLEKA
ncbi:MAG: Adaptive-response sensory-kinase SasA [Saprospiraceae bacterium]|nr:Adaptive-response sensory-kinase SasA [Saprospiraceae bacterium]